MTNEELNRSLYDRMSAEMAEYQKQLITQSPEDILKNAHEYVLRKDILSSLEHNSLGNQQAEALLTVEKPLQSVCETFSGRDTGHMNFIRENIEKAADSVIRQNRERQRELTETPLYRFPVSHARKHGELEQYRASRRACVACRNAIDAAIQEHFRGFDLDTAAVREVVRDFGYERTLYVLANTVRQKSWDGRFSPENKRWAMTVSIREDRDSMGRDKNIDFILRSHSVKADAFIKAARHEYLLTQPLSVKEIIAEAERIYAALMAASEPDSPDGAHFTAEISPDFLERANKKNMDAMKLLIPFRSVSFSTLENRSGIFALISKDEDRTPKTMPRSPGKTRKKRPER